MIATYIQELLATNNRVIVPNFGAFLVRATSKSKDANTLEEKLKDIYFSPFLKFNDELLEKYIIKKEGVSKEQAAEKIKEFIDLVKKELDQEKPFEIKDFGHFEADKQGKVQFVTIAKEKKEAKETKAPSKAATQTKTSTSKKAAPKEEEKKATTDSDKSKEKEPAKPSSKKTEEVKKEPAKAEEPKKETKLEEFKEEKKEPVSEAAKKAKKTYKSSETKPIYSYQKEKKSINKGLVWAIAIGVPVAAIFVWALLNLNTVKKVFNKEKAKTEQKAEVKTDNKKPAQTKSAEKPKKETPVAKDTKKATETKTEEKVQKPVAPQKKYYIIAGSFKNEKYAISYMNKLKEQGYKAEKLAERNGMHAVSYSSFVDKRKAIAEYKFLAQEKGLQTWILYY